MDFKPGDKVLVKTGPCQGLGGTLVHRIPAFSSSTEWYFRPIGANTLSYTHHTVTEDQLELVSSASMYQKDPAPIINPHMTPAASYWPPAPPKCECGATKLGSNFHSTWCPLYIKS